MAGGRRGKQFKRRFDQKTDGVPGKGRERANQLVEKGGGPRSIKGNGGKERGPGNLKFLPPRTEDHARGRDWGQLKRGKNKPGGKDSGENGPCQGPSALMPSRRGGVRRKIAF